MIFDVKERFSLTDGFIEQYKGKQPEWGPLGYVTFKRSYARELPNNQTEEFWQTCKRVVEGVFTIQLNHCRQLKLPWNAHKSQHSAQEMYKRMFEFKWLPPGRGLYSMGSDVVYNRGSMYLYNCAFVSTKDIDYDFTDPFCWMMDISMCGVGVGYDTDGANKVKVLKPTKSEDLCVIEDTREGWTSAVEKILLAYTNRTHKICDFDYSLIRPSGAPLVTSGGIAPGPQPLIECIDTLNKFFIDREGKLLSSVDIVDLMNIIGKCVVAGGKRRTAQIAFGDPNDSDYTTMKDPKHPELMQWRWASNNSIYGYEGLDYTKFAEQIATNGEPGIIYLDKIQHYGRLKDPYGDYDLRAKGVNPSLRKGTKVLTTSGIYNIEDLNEFSLINLDEKKVKAKCFYSGNKTLYKITLEGGHKYYATKEHKWPVITKGKVTTDKLKSGDYLPIIEKDQLFEGNLGTKNDGFFIGWLLGDGWITTRTDNCKTQIGLITAEDEKYIQKKLEKHLRLIGSNAKFSKDNELNTQNQAIKDYLTSFGVEHKREGLPKSIWLDGSENFRKGVIDGLFSSDGYISERIGFTSSHKKLAEDVSELLGFYGIKTYIKSSLIKGSFPNGKDYKKLYKSYVVRVSMESVKHFKKLFKLSNKRKQEKLSALSSVKENKKRIKIINIEKTNLKEDVYDISVSDNINCFDLGHCLTGNCAEISLESYETCVSADTKIQTRDGLKTISEVVGEEVEVWNGEKWSKVSPKITGKNRKLYRVTISDGSYLDCTAEHKWLINTSKNVFKEKTTLELLNGDKLPKFVLPSSGYTEDCSYEYGFFAGDGFMDNGKSMACYCADPNKLGGLTLKGKLYKPQIKEGYSFPVQRINFSKVLDHDLCEMINDKEEGLPEDISYWNQESLLEFLAGFIDTDGTITNKGTNGEGFIIYGTEKKLRDLQLICRRAGINNTGLSLVQEKGSKTNKGIRNYSLYSLRIHSSQCNLIPTRLKKIGIISSGIKKNNAYKSSNISSIRRQRVISVQELPGLHKTYCFNEPEKHQAVFNNVLTKQCNICETFPSRHEDYEDYKKTLKYAYMYVKTVTLVPTHSEKTNQVQLKNRRVGVSQSGIVQAIERFGAKKYFELCDKGYLELKKLDKIYSDWLCVPLSIKRTTIKPSGTVSLLPGVTPGVHYAHSEYYWRTIRFSPNSPLLAAIEKAGYRIEESEYGDNTMVVYFPVKESNFRFSKEQVSIWQQLELGSKMQYYWADNSVSQTVTFNKDEAKQLKTALEFYEDQLKTVSFLPLTDHKYAQAPYQEITKEEYDEAIKNLKPIKFKTNTHEFEEKFCDGETCLL